jgi:hypothetical protein
VDTVQILPSVLVAILVTASTVLPTATHNVPFQLIEFTVENIVDAFDDAYQI